MINNVYDNKNAMYADNDVVLGNRKIGHLNDAFAIGNRNTWPRYDDYMHGNRYAGYSDNVINHGSGYAGGHTSDASAGKWKGQVVTILAAQLTFTPGQYQNIMHMLNGENSNYRARSNLANMTSTSITLGTLSVADKITEKIES